MKLVTIIGARPQFIKAAIVSRAIAESNRDADGSRTRIEEIIVHTGQHYDYNMSDIFFQELGLPEPAYSLGIGSSRHGEQTGRILADVEKVLIAEKPETVLVYGDTNSTLAGALAAAKLHIPVAHVEAGLRSYSKYMPEEINRVLTDHVSTLLFCPTKNAVRNLQKEGFDRLINDGALVSPGSPTCPDARSPSTPIVTNVGDVMLDMALRIRGNLGDGEVFLRHGVKQAPFALVTIHRAENTDDADRLRSIVEALNDISKEIEIVLPLHPRTEKVVQNDRIRTSFRPIEPVGYRDLMKLLDRADIVLTDSGGLQKEAFFFQKPCVTLRDQTEWTELVESGCNRLAGADKDRIVECFREMMNARCEFDSGIYGDGNASGKIVEAILSKDPIVEDFCENSLHGAAA